ncbi:CLUMA_CG010569, isoform A [Clunio marinus]|uniref:Palmitoyl-protein thioesterase 1 n=1 Tax=Clunio marinus TaxID=568069 RepID=A0A1J1IC94_9DIPT|nr:CLUMA_CG010569, isoform A [Clunio marinus]
MLKNVLQLVIVICSFIEFVRLENYLPILLWHSAGAPCIGTEINTYINFIKLKLGNDVYIRSACLDNNPSIDNFKSLTIHPFDQIKYIHNVILHDKKFANGYNAIGLSQGGLFMRALAQMYPNPPMRNLITLGTPHQGVHHYPRCQQTLGSICNHIRSSINHIAYLPWIQKSVVPLTYWHDTNHQRYRRKSSFLAVINNERYYNENYVSNLLKLNRIVLVKYRKDISIVPSESSWFGYYNSNRVEYPMEETEIYKKNSLGLRYLKDSGKMVFLMGPVDHLNFDPAWFELNIIPYLI